MVNDIKSYPYSSYYDYINNDCSFTDIDFLLTMLNESKAVAIEQFEQLHKIDEVENYEITESQRKSPESIRRIIMSEIDGEEPGEIKLMNKAERDKLIVKFVFEKGISKSALERATGISRRAIIRICNKM